MSIKVVISFIYNNDCSDLLCLDNHLFRFFPGINVSYWIIRVQKNNNTGIGSNRAQNIFNIYRQILFIGDRDVLQTEYVTVYPIHFKGRRDGYNFFFRFSESFEKISYRRVGTVCRKDIVVAYPDKRSVFV